MSRHPSVQEIVNALVGSWQGKGEGGYPTIDSFKYREQLTVSERADHPALLYDQRAWRKTPDGEVVSHWETGLLRISSDHTVKVFNAQGGRSEAMTGAWERVDGEWVFRLESHEYAGDERVLRSTRVLRLDGHVLTYEMKMHTTATDQMLTHLKATLERHT